MNTKHKNYEILNLIGYGLSKFNNPFINEFGFDKKNDFYSFCVDNKIAETNSTIKSRMDLFDPFFPNSRKGWWQKGNTYIHRKLLIDNLFGNESVKEFAQIVKMYMNNEYDINYIKEVKPLTISKFKKLQETGLEAELYFLNNFENIFKFKNGILEDARLYGDGYDFQVSVNKNIYLAEVKGIREPKGIFRLTQKEYEKANEYKENYIVTIVLNMNNEPKLLEIENPIKELRFKENIITSKEVKEYILMDEIC